MLEEGVFLNGLRSEGLLRSDQDLAMQSYALQATVTGFLMIEAQQAEESSLSLAQRADALAQTIHAAFEPEQATQLETLQRFAAEMGARLEQLIAAFEARIQTPMK